MNEITQVPESVSSAGYEFSYSSWTAGSYITLHNVPWNADYRDVVKFDNQAGLNNYLENLSGPKLPINNMTYLRMGQPVRIDIPFNAANRYNYLKVTNPAMPVTGDIPRTFYYFINSMEMLTPNTTELTLQLDVWQTYVYETYLGNCYIERGHIGIANENQFQDYGREFLTIPEGLDIGGEYQVVDQWKRHIASAKGEDYSILVTSTTSLTAAPGTVKEPNLQSAEGSSFENLPNGASLYLFDNITHFKEFLFSFQTMPWVTQGIISIMAIPQNVDYALDYDEHTVGAITIKELKGTMFNTFPVKLKENWRDGLDESIPERYQHLDKFKVYPYTALEMTSYTATPLLLKPESWANPDAIVVEFPHFAPPSPRLAFVPYRYNAAGEYDPTWADMIDENGDFHDAGEFLDISTGIYNFPTFSLVNNAYISFMASNTNSIAYQHQSAEWTQQRALAGAVNQYNQAGSGIDTSQKVNQIGITAAQQQMTLANDTAASNAVMNGVGSVIGAASGGSPVSAVTGVGRSIANYAIQTNQNMQSTAISNTASARANQAQNKNAGYVRDSNMDYAEFSSKGDYENTIASIQAKIQDARLIQPTTSGQVGGEAFNLSVYKWGYDVKVKMLQKSSMRAVGEYWLRYGYQVNQFAQMPGDIRVMENFTYWKLRETYIVNAPYPEHFKQTMRGIFEKGVTVWRDPVKIGTIDIADNAPLEGITL